MKKEFDKRTVIIIDWHKNKKSTGYIKTIHGANPPDEVLKMHINDLLRELKTKLRVELEP